MEENGISCPKSVQEILSNTKYDNMCLLATFKQEDLNNITTFYRDTLHLLIDDSEKERYYGIFKNKPELFSLQGGDGKTILRIAEECKRILRKRQSSQAQVNPHLLIILKLLTNICVQ